MLKVSKIQLVKLTMPHNVVINLVFTQNKHRYCKCFMITAVMTNKQSAAGQLPGMSLQQLTHSSHLGRDQTTRFSLSFRVRSVTVLETLASQNRLTIKLDLCSLVLALLSLRLSSEHHIWNQFTGETTEEECSALYPAVLWRPDGGDSKFPH